MTLPEMIDARRAAERARAFDKAFTNLLWMVPVFVAFVWIFAQLITFAIEVYFGAFPAAPALPL